MMMLHLSLEVHCSPDLLQQFCTSTQFRCVMLPYILAWFRTLLQSYGFLIEFVLCSAFFSYHCADHSLCLTVWNTNDDHNARQCDSFIVFLWVYVLLCQLQPHICCNITWPPKSFRRVWLFVPNVDFTEIDINSFQLTFLILDHVYQLLQYVLITLQSNHECTSLTLRIFAILNVVWDKRSSCSVFVDDSSPVSLVEKTRPRLPNLTASCFLDWNSTYLWYAK